jgi:predicted nucleic acid-binding protein
VAGGEPIYYWDTCLFLAWIKDEERKSGEMAGVREVIERSKRREVKIVTSVLTTVEILSGKIPVGMATLFEGLMKRVYRIGMETKIAGVAHDLRDYYSIRKAEFGGKTLSTPDAIHLATAIIYRVTEFHTFDNDGDAKSLGLLPLSGDVGGNRLTICKPQAKNLELDLRKPKPGKPPDPTIPNNTNAS